MLKRCRYKQKNITCFSLEAAELPQRACKVAKGTSNNCGTFLMSLLYSELTRSSVMHGNIQREETLSHHNPWECKYIVAYWAKHHIFQTNYKNRISNLLQGEKKKKLITQRNYCLFFSFFVPNSSNFFLFFLFFIFYCLLLKRIKRSNLL